MKWLSDFTGAYQVMSLVDIIHLYFSSTNRETIRKGKLIKDILCILPSLLCIAFVDFWIVWEYISLYGLSHAIRPIFYTCTILPLCGEEKDYIND